VEVVFTTKGTPDEVRKRVEKEATYAAAGIVPPPVAGTPAAAGSDGSFPSAQPTGLKGLWSKITGR
jgi:hypothetical protein